MTYASQAHLESRYGAANVAQWSNLDADSLSADTARIAESLAWADEYINSKFRSSRYLVPFSSVPLIITEIACRIAVHWLYEARGFRDDAESNRLQSLKDSADLWIDEIIAGQREIDAMIMISSGDAPEVVGS